MFPSVVPLHRTASYALLTRPPLIEGASSFSPFDLHVLGTPPAFVLSQDQTLRLILDRNSSSFTGSAFFKLVSSLFCPYSSVMVPVGAVSVTRVWRATGDILLSLERFVNPFFAVFLFFFEFLFRAGGAAFIFCLCRFLFVFASVLHGFVYFFFVFFRVFSFFG